MRKATLRVYLRDHHAAAAAGVSLARRTLGADHPLARRIADDRRTLEDVMRHADVEPSQVKVALALAGDQLGRVKADRRLSTKPQLARLVALETLVVGVRGKQALWRALGVAHVPALATFDFEALAASAETQAHDLELERVLTAATALTEAPTGAESVA